jgi:serine/threonine protein kinase
VAGEQPDDVHAEIDIMRACKHDAIVRFFAWLMPEPNIYWIIMELCDMGSALTLMRGLQRGLQEAEMSTILFDTLKGLSYLVDNHFMHRDVKVPLVSRAVSASCLTRVQRAGCQYPSEPQWLCQVG